MKTSRVFSLLLLLNAPLWVSFQADAALSLANPNRGEQIIANHFRAETAKLSERCLTDIRTLDDWTSRRARYREQLLETLGLWPMPANSRISRS